MLKEILTSPATLRVILYVLAPLAAMVPGVTIDQAAGVITIDIQSAMLAVAAGATVSGGVFAMFGKK